MKTRQGRTNTRQAGRLVGARLLLVEDAHALRQVLRTMLALEGATVMEAGTGLDALELRRREPFDLVLCSRTWPGVQCVASPETVRGHQSAGSATRRGRSR